MQVSASRLADTAGGVHHICDFRCCGSHVTAQVVDGIRHIGYLGARLSESRFPFCHVVSRRFCINVPRSGHFGGIVQITLLAGLLVVQEDFIIVLTGLSQRCGDLCHLVPLDRNLRCHFEDCVLHDRPFFRVNAAIVIHDAANVLDRIRRLRLVFLRHIGSFLGHEGGRRGERCHDAQTSFPDYTQSVCYCAAQ